MRGRVKVRGRGRIGVEREATQALRLPNARSVVELKRCCQLFQSQRIEGASAVDVGFRAHHGHALLKAESAVGGARVHGVDGGRGKCSVGSVQVELRTRTFLQGKRERER